jgi:hypothetical protein
MLLPSSSLLSVSKTKSGQASQKGAKVAAQKKNTKKGQTTLKSSKPVGKVSKEEDALIQAAERYHQQISGKKIEPSATLRKNTATSLQINNSPAVEATFAERDLSVNIYTGNPGIYQTEGDTLNFWSFTPVQIDSITKTSTISAQPEKPYGFNGKELKSEGQDWSFFLILIGWTVFASLQFGFAKYIVQVFQSIFNFSIAARLFRERGYNNNFGIFRLNIIFFLFLPFPIFLIARDNGMSMMGSSGIEFYLIVFVVVNAYFMLKILLYKILGSIFSKRETTGELIFNMMLYHNVLGLLLLPVATLHAWVPGFAPFSLFIVPALIAIFYLLSIVRSIYFAFREGISIFYLILYLCTLEILPILLVVKLATGA